MVTFAKNLIKLVRTTFRQAVLARVGREYRILRLSVLMLGMSGSILLACSGGSEGGHDVADGDVKDMAEAQDLHGDVGANDATVCIGMDPCLFTLNRCLSLAGKEMEFSKCLEAVSDVPIGSSIAACLDGAGGKAPSWLVLGEQNCGPGECCGDEDWHLSDAECGQFVACMENGSTVALVTTGGEPVLTGLTPFCQKVVDGCRLAQNGWGLLAAYEILGCEGRCERSLVDATTAAAAADCYWAAAATPPPQPGDLPWNEGFVVLGETACAALLTCFDQAGVAQDFEQPRSCLDGYR